MKGYELLDKAPYINNNGEYIIKTFKRLPNNKSDVEFRYETLSRFQLAELDLYLRDSRNLDFLKTRIKQFKDIYGGLPVDIVVPNYKNKSITIDDYVSKLSEHIYFHERQMFGTTVLCIDVIEEL